MIKFLNKYFPNGAGVSVYLYGDIGAVVDPEDVVNDLNELKREYQNIDIHINSNGGSIPEGIAIYNAIRSCDAVQKIVVDGYAASMAAIIALCGKPLYMMQYSFLMLHNASGTMYGNADDMLQTARLLESMQHNIASMISGKTGRTPDDIEREYFDGKDHWITAEDCVKSGMAEGIISPDESQADRLASMTKDSLFNYYNRRLTMKAHNNSNDMILDELKKRPGFEDIKNEADALSQVDSLQSRSVKLEMAEKQLEAKDKEVKELKARLEENENRFIDSYLEQAVRDGKIAETAKDNFKALMKSDKENTMKVIDTMAKKTGRVSAYLGSGGDDPMLKMTFDELDKKNLLAKFQQKYPERFEQMYKDKFNNED